MFINKETNSSIYMIISKFYRLTHALLISAYFAGIVLVGSGLLVFKNTHLISYNSIILAVIIFVIYLAVILLTNRFLKKFGEMSRLIVPIAILIGIFAPFFVLLPSFYLQSFFSISKYYFYIINYLGLTAGTLFLYYELWIKSSPDIKEDVKRIEYVKEEMRFFIEILRGGLFLLAAALFSVVYAQSFQGFINKIEMFLIMFTVTGFIFLFLVPLYFIYYKKLNHLR